VVALHASMYDIQYTLLLCLFPSILAISFLYFQNIVYLFFMVVTIISFYQAIHSDPGYIRKTTTPEDRRALILTLAEQGKLDSRNFCVTCSVSAIFFNICENI
jgi:hypothetical protein